MKKKYELEGITHICHMPSHLNKSLVIARGRLKHIPPELFCERKVALKQIMLMKKVDRKIFIKTTAITKNFPRTSQPNLFTV